MTTATIHPAGATTRAPATRTGSTSTRTLRLTRRGRLFAVAALLVALVVGLGMLSGTTQAAGHTAKRAVPTVTVRPGESLWQVAARVAPHADPRLVVARIEAYNHLRGPQVFAGQQLAVPVG